MTNAWEAKARADAISLQETRVNAVMYEIDQEIQETADGGNYYIKYFIPQKVRDLEWQPFDTKKLVQRLEILGFIVSIESEANPDCTHNEYLLIRWDEIRERGQRLEFGF